MIVPVREEDLRDCLNIIHRAYAPAAKRFGLNDENCPDSGRATLSYDRFHAEYESGEMMYGYRENEELIGYIGLNISENVLKIDDIVVLPEHQCKGIGTAFLGFIKQLAAENKCGKITLGMIYDNKELLRWYESNGFKLSHLKQYPKSPVTSGYMEMLI